MLATLRYAVSGARSCGAAPLLLRIDLRSYGKGEKKWTEMPWREAAFLYAYMYA